MELMNYSSGLSKQKHRSVYSCSSRADHTILFHLEYILSAAMISDLVRCWFSGDAWFGSRFCQRDGRFFGNLLQESYEEITEKDHFKEYHNYWLSREYSKPIPSHCKDCFLLKGHYHRYTLNEGHQNGLEFCDHLDLQNNQADGADAIQYDLISKAL